MADIVAVLWSGARVAGVKLGSCPGAQLPPDYGNLLNQVCCAAPEMVERKGHTAYAISLCVQRICQATQREQPHSRPHPSSVRTQQCCTAA